MCSSDLKVVYHPKHMSAEKLQELLAYAWDTFYHDEPQEIKMSKLFTQVIRKEMEDNTYRPRKPELRDMAFGRKAG